MLNDIRSNMTASLNHAVKNFSTLRVGAARADILDGITVFLYGQNLPIKQTATINVTDNFTLTVTPFDKSNAKAIVKAIQEANLGVGVISEANLIRVTMPKITQENRIQLIKVLKNYLEEAKVSIRNIRRNAMDAIKNMKKDSLISENEMKRYETEIQKITDEFIDKIEEAATKREKEIMTV
jgi:ribosome recycling factor